MTGKVVRRGFMLNEKTAGRGENQTAFVSPTSAEEIKPPCEKLLVSSNTCRGQNKYVWKIANF